MIPDHIHAYGARVAQNMSATSNYPQASAGGDPTGGPWAAKRRRRQEHVHRCPTSPVGLEQPFTKWNRLILTAIIIPAAPPRGQDD
jgi:hypothetical protein